MEHPKTIFCDIDGTLIKHNQNMARQHAQTPELLPGALEALLEWEKGGYRIILTTGRRESTRLQTETQLKELGIFWDELIMGLPRGVRVVINDLKPDSAQATCQAVNVVRNVGLTGTNI